MQLRLIKNPPASWPSSSTIERTPELDPERGGNTRVPCGWPGTGDQLSIDDFTYQILWQSAQVLVGRWLFGAGLH